MTKVQPFSNMKEDVGRIFENKMKWWLMSCQWSGLYLGNSPGDNIHMSKRRTWLKRVWQIISCVTVLYLLVYMVLLGYRFHSKTMFTPRWIQNFNVFIWCSGVSLWLLSVMIGFGRGNLYSWCHEVSLYCDEYGLNEKAVEFVKKIPSKVVRNFIFNIVMTGLAVFIYDLVPEIGHSIYLFPYEMRALNIIAVVIHIFLQNFTFSNLGPIVEICSSLVSHEMDRVNKDLEGCQEKNISSASMSTINLHDKTDVSMRLDKAMEQHSRICDLIGHFNKCLYHYAAASFLIGLPISCFALYILITKVNHSVDIGMTAFTLITSLVPIITNCMIGCCVNHKAHKALDYIWKLPNEKLQESTMRNLSQLTARLTGTSIGYTVYGFFTFTMPAVLSIIGCILTYFIVVIQFKPPEQTDCTSVCNNSLSAWCVTNQTGLV